MLSVNKKIILHIIFIVIEKLSLLLNIAIWKKYAKSIQFERLS